MTTSSRPIRIYTDDRITLNNFVNLWPLPENKNIFMESHPARTRNTNLADTFKFYSL